MASFLVAVVCLGSPVDFGVLNQVPPMREAAFQRYEKGANGSPEERGNAEHAYIKDLAAIAFKLRDTYYNRGPAANDYEKRLQVSEVLLNSIESWTLLLENIGYPKNVVAGSGLFYEREVFMRRVQLTEQVILKMSKAIVRESWDWEAKGAPPIPFDYKAWLAAWYSSGEVFTEKTGPQEQDELDLLKEELRLQKKSDDELRQRVATLPQESLRAHGMHRLEPRDSLGRVAQQYGVSVGDLARWNSIKDPGRLKVGDLLVVTKANDTSDR